MLACFQKDTDRFCLLQKLEKMELAGEMITNSYDCPLFTLTSTLLYVHTSFIQNAVSMQHECSEECVFKETDSTRKVERENVHHSSLVFCHDYTSSLFCLNIFCMNC